VKRYGHSGRKVSWKIWKKSKLNSEKIWKIWKKSKLKCGKYGGKVSWIVKRYGKWENVLLR
jgi:hypothetical protein